MKKSKIIPTLSLAFVFATVTCHGQVTTKFIKKGCVNLNDSAFFDIMRYNANHQKKYYLDSAITLLKLAIVCDSSYFVAYKNLADAYADEGKVVLAIQIVKKLVNLGGDSTFYMIWQAALYRRNNQLDSANKTYEKVSLIYDQKLKTNPTDINILSRKILLIDLTKGEEEAKKSLNQLKRKYPKDSTALTDQTKYIFFLQN